MEPDDSRCLRLIVEITIHGVAHHRPEFLKRPGLGGYAPPQGRGAAPAFLGFRDLKMISDFMAPACPADASLSKRQFNRDNGKVRVSSGH
jgi:hypothetical protein